jgi:hypothetical protein
MPSFNYYYGQADPAKPYVSKAYANKGSLPPANAVRVAPPEPSGGKWPCLGQNGQWALREDHRGETGYVNGVQTEIKLVGPYPLGWSADPPPPTAEEERASSIAGCQAKLSEIDFKSTRSIRTIRVLEDRMAAMVGITDPEGLGAQLAAEKAFLAGLEAQAKAERAKLAALNGGGHVDG